MINRSQLGRTTMATGTKTKTKTKKKQRVGFSNPINAMVKDKKQSRIRVKKGPKKGSETIYFTSSERGGPKGFSKKGTAKTRTTVTGKKVTDIKGKAFKKKLDKQTDVSRPRIFTKATTAEKIAGLKQTHRFKRRKKQS
jgi:hypothetical protein|tara:strand:+ start:52 stop:468 length:417 start_codon:yes stop_codon:yes gene_type:complete